MPIAQRRWYGFYSRNPSQIQALTRALPSHLRPKHTFTDKDIANTNHYNSAIKTPLKKRDFGAIFRELYKKDGTAFLGKFDFTAPNTPKRVAEIAVCATAFFRDVLDHQSPRRSSGNSNDEEVYPRIERKVVRQHLSRERNRSLAEFCKRRDKYKCRVCGITFEEVYGPIGQGFAEAHHVIPLHRLAKTVKTLPQQLITVCSNCHRMLHRMRGQSGDVQDLKRRMK